MGWDGWVQVMREREERERDRRKCLNKTHIFSEMSYRSRDIDRTIVVFF